jgi:hypothetical protein
MSEPYLFSKYSILSNRPEHKDFSGGYHEIYYPLPSWFKNWNKRKIIKIYGCSFAFLESENKEPKPSTRYSNQFITVHSNIARDNVQNMPGVWELKESATQKEEEIYANCLMVVNNYYTPKIIDVTDADFSEIVIWFKDGYGEKIPLRTSYSSEHGVLDEIYQALFKIECELAIGDM